MERLKRICKTKLDQMLSGNFMWGCQFQSNGNKNSIICQQANVCRGLGSVYNFDCLLCNVADDLTRLCEAALHLVSGKVSIAFLVLKSGHAQEAAFNEVFEWLQGVFPVDYKRTNTRNLIYNNCSSIVTLNPRPRSAIRNFIRRILSYYLSFSVLIRIAFHVNDLMPEIGVQLMIIMHSKLIDFRFPKKTAKTFWRQTMFSILKILISSVTITA